MSRTQISLPVILRGLATWTAANIATPKFTVENTTVPSVQCLASLLLVKAAVRGNQQVTLDVKLFCVVLKQSRMKTSMANDRHISKPSEPEPSTQYTTWALYRARLWGQKADTARQGKAGPLQGHGPPPLEEGCPSFPFCPWKRTSFLRLLPLLSEISIQVRLGLFPPQPTSSSFSKEYSRNSLQTALYQLQWASSHNRVTWCFFTVSFTWKAAGISLSLTCLLSACFLGYPLGIFGSSGEDSTPLWTLYWEGSLFSLSGLMGMGQAWEYTSQQTPKSRAGPHPRAKSPERTPFSAELV